MNELEEYLEELKLKKLPRERLALYMENRKAFKVGSFICFCGLITPKDRMCDHCGAVVPFAQVESFCDYCGKDLILSGQARAFDQLHHFCNREHYLWYKMRKRGYPQ